MIYKGLEVTCLQDIELDGALSRFPKEVKKVFDHTIDKHIYGQEIRFIPKGEVEITLSSLDNFEEPMAEVFYGDFGSAHEVHIGKGTKIKVGPNPYLGTEVFDKLAKISSFNPEVVRIIILAKKVSIDEVKGEFVLPKETDLPAKKMLVYGTSLSQGTSGHVAYSNYPWLLARKLNMDVDNYSLAGTCLLEKETVDFLSSLKKDYSLIIFEPSTNLYARGFSTEEFIEKCKYTLDSFRKNYPEALIVCVDLFESLFDYGLTGKFKPVCSTDDYRKALNDLVSEYHEKVICLKAKELLSFHNITADLMHPTTIGYFEIAENIYKKVKDLL